MTLAVDSAVLRRAGAAFEQSADGLAGLQAQTPLNDAAVTVPALTTAGTCRATASELSAEVTAVSDSARRFGEILDTAARAYEARDHPAPAA
jgi:hypothetical protein